MRPWLFTLGDTGVPSYWVLMAVGFCAAIAFVYRGARRDNLPQRAVLDLCLIVIVCGVVGARLMHVLVEEDPLQPGRPILLHYLDHPGEIFGLWNGLAFYGGLLLALPAAVAFIRIRKLPLWPTLDLFGVAVPLGMVFARIGCFLAGCCHGTPTTWPWGVTFEDPYSLARPLGVPLHPTQLLEAALALFLFLSLWFFWRRKARYAGQVFWSFVSLYSIGRFGLEFLRGDNRGLYFGELLSSSQIVAIGLLVVGLGFMLVLSRRAKPAEA
jgi:phosphatidylglycerol---prolipoprotein diacylglyceryl transferase